LANELLSPLVARSRDVVAPDLLQRFVDTFLYTSDALFVDEITRVDGDGRALEALLDTTREFPLARCQRTSALHPAHVSAAELLMATGSLGCLHAYLFHGCRWDEGWAGFGNRVHRADWKRLATIGPPIVLESKETRTRVGSRRIVIRYAFRFLQESRVVYVGDQSAMFVKGMPLGALLASEPATPDNDTIPGDPPNPGQATPGHQR
jgi:hypothetical protein